MDRYKEKYSKVLIAISNDEYENIIGMWEKTYQCAKELQMSMNSLKCAIRRNSVVRKINGKIEWMVVEND